MAPIGLIAWKEFKTYFTSWMAYVLMAGWLLIGGLLFSVLLRQPDNFQISAVYPFLITVLLFVVPLITMRLVAEESEAGTLELLFTTPITEWQVTLGKFFGAWGFIGVLLLLTTQYAIIAARFGTVESGPLWGSAVALLCVGASFAAFGLFCSSLTKSQVVAGFLTFGGLLLSWMLSFVAQSAPTNPVATFVGQWSVFSHFLAMLRGAIDTRDLVFFISLTLFFLFATTRVLESRRWR
jgi:ABC-2 type transport system permease protein